MKGKILSVIAGVYSVFLEDETIASFTPRGLFRHLNMKPCVGDDVIVDNGMIVSILPRKNILPRPSICNIDCALIVVSMKEPDYSSYLLDKFLSLMNLNGISSLIVLSKVDLAERAVVDRIIEEYRGIGISVIPTSKVTGEGLERVRDAIRGKTVAFMGQTGAGKSSLVNCLYPDIKRREGEYSKALHRGKHQTKEVVIFPLPDTYLADTPGFSSLELTCYREELKDVFPFFIRETHCFFQDCMHVGEPKCEIRNEVHRGRIPKEHYDNYLRIREELIFRKDRFQ